jgi:hypothetical protein
MVGPEVGAVGATCRRAAVAGFVLSVLTLGGCGRATTVRTTLPGPRVGVPLAFRGGQPLARWASQAGIIVEPTALRPWARAALARLGGPSAGGGPRLWCPGSSLAQWVATWATPGMQTVSVPVLRTVPGVPPLLARLGAGALPTRRPRVTVEQGPGGRWRTAWVSPRPVRTTADARLEAELAQALPAGATAVLVTGTGAVRALAAGRDAPPPWAPEPVGPALEPVVLAEARGPWWSGPPGDVSVPTGLVMATGRWSVGDALAAYRRLGIGRRPLPGVPAVPLPAAAAVSPASLLLAGQGVWASPLALARAWAALANGGYLPSLHVVAARRVPSESRVASAEAVASVLHALPTGAGGHLWFVGPSHPAVAVLFRPVPAVLVAVGLPNLRALAQVVSRLTPHEGADWS